jgi:hypothetical protein
LMSCGGQLKISQSPLPFGACIMSMYFIALAPFQAT